MVVSIYWDGYSLGWVVTCKGQVGSSRQTRAYYPLGCNCTGRGVVKVKPIVSAGTIGLTVSGIL